MNFDEFDEFSMMKIEKTDNTLVNQGDKTPSKGNGIGGAVADNFDKIVDLAADVVQIQKMKVQSEAVLKKMAEDRKALVAEAEAYALKRNADTKSVVDRMNIVRLMLRDFYDANSGNISSEDFRIIITETINQMGKMQ